MSQWTDMILMLLILTDFSLLGSSRLGACIRFVACQGVLLGALTLVTPEETISLRPVILAILSIGLKGAAFPWLLLRALLEANVRHEIEPFVGYNLSLDRKSVV